MTVAPKFLGPDGVLRQTYTFFTTLSDRFFTGTMDASTADMQVSVRGAVFSSDPDMITFEGTTFTIPNPSVYPNGLHLLQGINQIKVKSVFTTGGSSAEATINANLSTEKDVASTVTAPSGIFVEKQDSTVQVFVEGLTTSTVQGYHFYASPSPGGGADGYFRINPTLVIMGTSVEQVTDLAVLNTDAAILTNPDGTPAADPLYVTVTGSQTDQAGTVLQLDYDESVEVPESTSRVRVQTSVQTVRLTQQYSFIHDRQATLSSIYPAIPQAALSGVPLEDPLYYVVTAMHFIDGVEIESAFSPEVGAFPLVVTATVGSFPTVSRQQIIDATVQSIYRTHPQLKIDPGSALRDTFIDPFATEAQRMRFVIQFLHDAQSFSTLMIIDDPGFSGVSVPVSQSPYKTALKQAFYLASDTDVQALIDNAFDKLASNFGKTRRGGQRARGEVLFYVTTPPASPIVFSIGTVVAAGSARFRTTSSASITAAGGGRNYDPVTGRYFARAYIQAEQAGATGVLAPGQINNLVNNTLGVQVTNEGWTYDGKNQESNKDLAIRALGALSSVDSGTLQGYTYNAVDVPGVAQVAVIEAGNALMMRDINPDNGRHVGGKVDIWVRSTEAVVAARVTDAFAFTFTIAYDMQLEPVGNLSDLIFRAVDPNLSEENPIIEMMDFPASGLEMRDISKGFSFNLTGCQVIAYNLIQLDGAYNDPADYDLTDKIRGDYRYRTSSQYVFTKQPVIQVNSLTGTVTGTVSPTVYGLYRASDPLVLGRSTEAGDYLMLTQPTNINGLTILSGDPIAVTGEEHTILDGIEYANFLGINPYTLHIYNRDRTIEYYGPLNITGGLQDWRIIDESGSSPLGIELTTSSRITAGQTVLFDYSHDENFSVEYEYNSVIGLTQSQIDADRHITADVLVKEAVTTPVDITATIVLQKGQSATRVDNLLRTNLSQLFGQLALGDPLYQSDVVRAIDQTTGVSYVVTPLTKMALGNGALVVRENLVTDTSTDWELLDSWSSPTVVVYLLLDSLSANTVDAGGAATEFRGVFQDEVRLTHVETMPNANGFPLRTTAGKAFIIGSGGAEILGYSDDATLAGLYPFATPAELLAKRISMTANRVAVSLVPSDTPTSHNYTVTYVASGDTGTQNQDPGPVEFLVPGNFDFTYDATTGTR